MEEKLISLVDTFAKLVTQHASMMQHLLDIHSALLEEILSTRGEAIVPDAPVRDMTGRIVR